MKTLFLGLVDKLPLAEAAERAAIEASIWEQFGVERAVMALDMSHFSLTVRRSGILSYLGLIRRMQALTAPIIERFEGVVVEFHADNVMAVFPDAAHAVHASIEINRALAEQAGADGVPLISVGIGIDHGRFLFVAGQNCYGDPVNVAFKLGEDLARPGEILLTEGARSRLGAGFAHPVTEQPASVSGLEFMTYSINYQGMK
jgi:adenylate cyclase